VYSWWLRTELTARVPAHSAISVQAIACILLVAACSNGRGATGTCEVEHLDVTWPATIERDGVATREQLYATVTPTNVTPELFDSLASTLVRGRAARGGVVWSVPAFNTDPGGIAVAHEVKLSRGEVPRIAGVFDSAAWGLLPSIARGAAQAGVEAGEFLAHDVSGTVAVLETKPVALRLDLTARDSAGRTIRVRGDARFGHRVERGPCNAVADVPGLRSDEAATPQPSRAGSGRTARASPGV
jgi:hypothetical protein